jgi:hypothetical protein
LKLARKDESGLVEVAYKLPNGTSDKPVRIYQSCEFFMLVSIGMVALIQLTVSFSNWLFVEH